MKVTKIQSEPPVDVSPNRTEKKPRADLDFQNVLKEAQAKTENSGPMPNAISSAEAKESIQSLPFSVDAPGISVGLEHATEARFQGIRFTEKVLELLEGYQKSMADPTMALKEIDPMVQSLSKGIETLDSLSKSLAPSDPLQKILTEVGIVSTIEVERFKRGEYL